VQNSQRRTKTTSRPTTKVNKNHLKTVSDAVKHQVTLNNVYFKVLMHFRLQELYQYMRMLVHRIPDAQKNATGTKQETANAEKKEEEIIPCQIESVSMC